MPFVLFVLIVVLNSGEPVIHVEAAPDMASCEAAAARLRPQIEADDDVRGFTLKCEQHTVGDKV